MMNILHINHSDWEGGAARAMYRLHKQLKNSGQESNLLVGKRVLTEKGIQSFYEAAKPFRSTFHKLIDRSTNELSRRAGIGAPSHLNSWLVSKSRTFAEAYIINMHNLHGDYFNLRALLKWGRKKPLVWTLHDMNSFTGHCAYSFDCQKFVSGCDGACLIPDLYPACPPRRIKAEWELRKQILDYLPHLSAVCPSKWLADECLKGLWKNHRVEVIPYGIDLEIFSPMDKTEARKSLGIDPGGQYILFGAQSLNDPRKGADLFWEAMERVKCDRVKLLVYGSGEFISPDGFKGDEIARLGKIWDERLMRLAYCSADLFAIPTRADNLPNTAIESIACGTPVVTFNVGGLAEIIDHLETGYIAAFGKVEDFARGLDLILSDQRLWEKMSFNCRKSAECRFSVEKMANSYLSLYRELINDKIDEE